MRGAIDLLAAKSRDAVASLALRIALHHVRSAALFVVNRGLISGLRAAGELADARIEGIMVPVGAESAIAESVERGRLTRVRQPFGHVDQKLVNALGRSEVAEVVVMPVAINQRVVNLLYLDNGPEPVPVTSIGALHVLTKAMARAYEHVIVERKQAGARR